MLLQIYRTCKFKAGIPSLSGTPMDRPLPHRAGVYMALLQLFFTLGWTTYAIYLPRLAADMGLSRAAVLWILMLDQAVFTVADFAMGVASDKVARVVGRLGRWVAAISLVSGLAFIALPLIARGGEAMTALFLAVTILWTVTSSALRAPPLMLLGKYSARPAVPYLASLALVGYGLAGAAAPYLATFLRDLDPRLPFIIASVAITAAAFALSRVERSLASQAPRPARAPLPAAEPRPGAASMGLFVVALVIVALGFQLHASINSAKMFLRFATPANLDLLLPVFWIGFNVAMFPMSRLTQRLGGFSVMGIAAIAGAGALIAAWLATSLGFLVSAQLIAGAAWGALLMSAFAAAIALGSTGREGRTLGLMFSALALATLARFAAVTADLPSHPLVASLIGWLPPLLWASGGAMLVALALTRRPSRAA